MNVTPRLRPMSIGDLLDAAFRLYRTHFLTFLGIVALLQVPMAIVQLLVTTLISGPTFVDFLRFTSRPPIARPGQNFFDVVPVGTILAVYGVTFGLVILQYLIVQNLINGALANAIGRAYLGRTITILEAYELGGRRYLALIVASLVPFMLGVVVFGTLAGCTGGVVLALGLRPGAESTFLTIVVVFMLLLGLLALLAIVGVFVYVRLLVTTQAIVLEGAGPLAALGRSWRLVGGSFWRTLGIVVLMALLVYLIASLPASAVAFVLTFSGDPVRNYVRNQVITTLLQNIGLIVALPLQLAVYTLIYYDLRIRKEGYDLEMLAQQAGMA